MKVINVFALVVVAESYSFAQGIPHTIPLAFLKYLPSL
jgi:hypothetical protein